MKKLSIVLLLGMSLTLISGCSPTGNTTASSSETTTTSTQEMITVNLKIVDNDKEVSNEKVELAETTSLMDLMNSKHQVEEKDGMILAIDDLKQDEQAGYYWTYTSKVNGQPRERRIPS